MANERNIQVLVSTQYFVVNNPALPQYQTAKALQRAAKSYGKITPTPFLQPKPVKPQPIDDDTPGGGGDVLEESVYYGFIPASVTGFNSLASALVTSISPQHVKTAIANGTIVKASNLPITDSNAPTVTTNGKYAYFLALVPQNQNYAVKAWNGINAYAPFDNQQDHYANGNLTLSVDGISYKVYADYAATSGTEYKITIE